MQVMHATFKLGSGVASSQLKHSCFDPQDLFMVLCFPHTSKNHTVSELPTLLSLGVWSSVCECMYAWIQGVFPPLSQGSTSTMTRTKWLLKINKQQWFSHWKGDIIDLGFQWLTDKVQLWKAGIGISVFLILSKHMVLVSGWVAWRCSI